MEITKYQSAHHFLKDSWTQKRAKNPAFSLRAWARQMGMISHTPLTLMLNGKRSIPKKYIPGLIKSLQLSPREGLYLETLIEYNQSKTANEKDLYFSRLKELVPKETINMVEMDTFRYLGDPLHCIILDMTDLKDFNADPKWIQARMQTKTSIKQIEEVLARLQTMGLLQRTDGKLKKTYKTITNIPDIADFGSQSYHQSVSALAMNLISHQPVNVREFNGYSMSIQKSKLPLAKSLIRDFTKKFMHEVEAVSSTGEETYQLNVQFFPVTKSKGEKNE